MFQLRITERDCYGERQTLVVVVRDGVAVDWIERGDHNLGPALASLVAYHATNRPCRAVPPFPPGTAYHASSWPRVAA